MTSATITDVDDFIAKIKAEFAPEVKIAENDLKAIGAAALAYIETNGLKDLYTIAMSVLTGAAVGTPYATILTSVVAQGTAAGISIAKGAESVVVAQAQADLIAAGTLAAINTVPAAGVVVENPVSAVPAA